MGKEDGQQLNSDDLITFPCEDLQMVDRLWVKYSDGKWGFSIQKQIWEECGSPTDYGEFEQKFCDLIGWTKNGSWQYPKHNLQESSEGELPSAIIFKSSIFVCWDAEESRIVMGWEGFENEFGLLSRTRICRLSGKRQS